MAKNVYLGVDKIIEALDYIESNGTQYIDTGVVPKSTTRVVIDFTYTKITGSNQLMGWGSSGGAEALCFGIYNTGNFTAWINKNYIPIDTGIVADTNRHTFDIMKGSQKFDGVEFGTDDTMSNTATTGQTLYLFGHHSEWVSNGANYLCNCRIHRCQIYDGDVLIRDYVPFKTTAGAFCLYDLVEKKEYPNKGTGEFLGGEVVEKITMQSDIAEEAKNMYISLNNVARRVKKGYIGIDNIARSFYEASGNNMAPEGTEYLFHFDSDGRNACNSSEIMTNGRIIESPSKFGNVLNPYSISNGQARTYINLSNNIPSAREAFNGKELTIEFWAYFTTTNFSTGHMMYGGLTVEYGMYFGAYSSSEFTLQLRKASSTSTIGFRYTLPNKDTLNTWHHVAIVFKDKQMKLFVDGKFAGSVSNDGSTAGLTDRYLSFMSGAYFDEVLVSTKALYSEEFTPPTNPYEVEV